MAAVGYGYNQHLYFPEIKTDKENVFDDPNIVKGSSRKVFGELSKPKPIPKGRRALGEIYRTSPPPVGHWYFPRTEEGGSDVDTEERPPTPSDDDYDSYDEDDCVEEGHTFDFKSSLFTPDRDYLIRNNGRKVYASDLEGKHIAVFGVCIPVLKDDYVARLCEAIIATHSDLSKTKGDFEVVLVVRVRPEFASDDANDPRARAAFRHFFSAFSCPAIPLSDAASRRALYPYMNLCNYHNPSAFLADKHGEVLVDNTSPFSRYGANLYPFTPERRLQLGKEAGSYCQGVPLEDLLDLQTSDVLCCPCGCDKHSSVSDLKHKLVLLYLCSDGHYIKTIHDILHQAQQHLDFEVVITFQISSDQGRPLSELRLRELLQSNGICGWLELPFRDKVSRRLFTSFSTETLLVKDQLIAVGPHSSFVDPYARQVLCGYGSLYGSDLYPFTRDAVRDTVLTKLGALTLPDLLTSAGVPHLVRSDGSTEPVSYLNGREVLLYCGYAVASAESPLLSSWEVDVVAWYRELEELNADVELVYLCLGVEDGASLEEHCLNVPWLTVPFNEDVTAAVAGPLSFFEEFSTDSKLVAFGSSGRPHTLRAHYVFESSSEPVTFPQEDNLLSEVNTLLKNEIELLSRLS